MTAIIYIILLIVFAAWFGELSVTLHPFSIHLLAWKKLIGIILIILGVALMNMSFHSSELKRLEKSGKITINKD